VAVIETMTCLPSLIGVSVGVVVPTAQADVVIANDIRMTNSKLSIFFMIKLPPDELFIID